MEQELVATTVAAAQRAHAQIGATGHADRIGRSRNRVALSVVPGQVIEVRFRPVQDRDQVATFVVRIHDPHGAGAVAEAALINADHREATVAVRPEAIGFTAAAKAMPVQHQRMRTGGTAIEGGRFQHLEADGLTRLRRQGDLIAAVAR